MENSALSDRMKEYERQYESTVPYNKYLIIRLDGHKFSKYTKGFKKPFDSILSEAMVETTKKLVERFNAVTGYTQSDEITLVLDPNFIKTEVDITHIDQVPPKTYIQSITNNGGTVRAWYDKIENNQIFGGRVQKIVSLASSYCTMIFNKNLYELTKWAYADNKIDRDYELFLMENKVGNAYFDARVFGIKERPEVLNALMFRGRDCIKNSKSMFAQAYCPHKELLNKNSDEQINYCLERAGKNWHKLEDTFKYGVLIKKTAYLKETENGNAVRTKLIRISEPINTYSEDNVKLVTQDKVEGY